MNKIHVRNRSSRKTIVIGENDITLDQVTDIARDNARVVISSKRDFVNKMKQSQKMLQHALEVDVPIYGVTTGYGAACGNRIKKHNTEELGNNLIKYHGCGTGDPLGIEETRASIVCRLACFARGHSGVSIDLLQAMADLLNKGITPIVPSLGSVGASGDLTPMSYIAACLSGDRDALYKGHRMKSSKAFSLAGLSPYRFLPKEPLGMMNGTSVMTGIAVLNLSKSRVIADAALAATALSLHALMGHERHFHPTVTDSKPHPGQQLAGERLRNLLSCTDCPQESGKEDDLQDPYSIRCAPQILGVAYDAFEWIEQWVGREVNSSNDNPLSDGDNGEIFMGGNFYGGHIVYAMDALKSALASVADMADRQMALLVDKRYNRGLPANLVKVTGDKQALNHGFKGMQITASALTAEALKNTMPAASFSRSTESHNQDKVSMGTIAARDAAWQCELVGRAVAVHLMAAVQACELRGDLDGRPALASLVKSVRKVVKETVFDRPMDKDIEALVNALPDLTRSL
ncbi:MAG: aromatic amino acid ammonia-lyase [Deltaproteobacteria bacterium]|nr:aromatic amino acid ammonia-lyase [Deltaproteobacteria bacterium]